MGFTYEYTYQDLCIIRTMNILSVLSAFTVHSALHVTKPYRYGFSAPGCTHDCTLLFWAHLWSSCLGSASQLYANKLYLNAAWRPCEMTVFQDLDPIGGFYS